MLYCVCVVRGRLRCFDGESIWVYKVQRTAFMDEVSFIGLDTLCEMVILLDMASILGQEIKNNYIGCVLKRNDHF